MVERDGKALVSNFLTFMSIGNRRELPCPRMRIWHSQKASYHDLRGFAQQVLNLFKRGNVCRRRRDRSFAEPTLRVD